MCEESPDFARDDGPMVGGDNGGLKFFLYNPAICVEFTPVVHEHEVPTPSHSAHVLDVDSSVCAETLTAP